MAKQLEEATQRASKWKLRCTDLRRELASAQSARTALEAALHVRLHLRISVCRPGGT